LFTFAQGDLWVNAFHGANTAAVQVLQSAGESTVVMANERLFIRIELVMAYCIDVFS